MFRFIPSLAIFTLTLSVSLGATPLRAQQDLKQEIARALGESQKGLAESIARIIEQRTSKLEKALQQRDAKDEDWDPNKKEGDGPRRRAPTSLRP